MSLLRHRLTVVVCIFFSFLVSCQPSEFEPIAVVTTVPDDVVVDQVVEETTVSQEIVFEPEFDQCESSSGFEQYVQLGQLASSEIRKDLVLKGVIGGEAGVSAVAKAKVEAAIEGHFGSTYTNVETYEQGIQISVPPHTKQRYIVTWREERSEGIVFYREGEVIYTASFSYRLGLQFVGAKGIDVPCDGTTTLGNDVIIVERVETEPNTESESAGEPMPLPIPTIAPTISLWNEQSNYIPTNGTQIIRSLSAGERLYLSGGSFVLGDTYCGEDATQLCIIIYEATYAQDVVINAVVTGNNYVARTNVFSFDDLIRIHQPYYWRDPNCGNGCAKVSIYNFKDGQLLGNPTMLTQP